MELSTTRNHMKYSILSAVLILTIQALGQDPPPSSSLDPTKWGVVYDIPETKRATVKTGVTYFKDAASDLQIDIYSPPGANKNKKLPAVIFLNAIGDQPDKVKSWAIYSSWPRLIAAHGMIGISMDADGSRIQESLKSLFAFLESDGAKHGIDATRLGVYAASANVSQSSIYLMGETASKGIKAAALYYGGAPQSVLRKDLPVLFVLAEGDMAGFGQQSVPLWQRVTESRAPWTLVFASRQPHAFDAFEDTDESRRLVKQTIDFWKTHLEPVPQPPWNPSDVRGIMSAIYMNNPARTEVLLRKYTSEHPNDGQALVQYARALMQQQKFPEAFAAFEHAAKLDPQNPGIAAGMGQIRFSERKYAEALPFLETAIARGFRSSQMYGQLAYSQLAVDKNREALATYEAAFQAGIPPGANTRGLAYYGLLQYGVRICSTEELR
jgi:hypothetical protein